MAKKTNKTSHILDLLTNGPAPEVGGSASSGGVQSHTSIPKKVTVVDEGSRNDKLSQEILSNLTDELENEVLQDSSTVSDAPPAEPADAQPQENAPVPPQTDTVQPEELDIELEILPDEEDEEYHFVNVMEELLMKQDLDSILRQYDVCTCPRCNADVRALTLTSLPSKYVVIGKRSFSPVLNYYENKFKISMLTALNRACTTVRERPHHKR